jgi:hypothetical protein
MADMKNSGTSESEQVECVTEEYRNLLHEAMLISEYVWYRCPNFETSEMDFLDIVVSNIITEIAKLVTTKYWKLSV